MRGSGACVVGGRHGGGRRAWQILRDTVNELAVRILLECILVLYGSRQILLSLTRMHCSRMRTACSSSCPGGRSPPDPPPPPWTEFLTHASENITLP